MEAVASDKDIKTPGTEPLPPGWRWVKLGEVCELNPCRPPKFIRSDEKPTTFVPMQAVDDRVGVIAKAETRPYVEVCKGYTCFAEGDVLFAKITPCMQNGKHAIAKGLIDGLGFGSTEFHVIRPKAEIISEWVHKYLTQPYVLRSAMAYFAGAVGQQRVPIGFIANLEIPLPPLPEQKRIAAILNEQMAAVEKARAATEAQLEAAKTLPAAYLRSVFNSPEAQQWPKKCLGEVCQIRGGKRLPQGTDFASGKTEFPYIRVLDFQDGTVNLYNLKYLDEETQKQIARYIISHKDVYISIAGTIGIVGIVPTELDSANLTENAARLIIHDKSNLFRDFLALFLSSPIGQEQIKLRTNMVGQPKLALERIATIEISLPSLSEQKRIAAILNEKMNYNKNLYKSIEQQLETINKLPSALLKRAFNGEL